MSRKSNIAFSLFVAAIVALSLVAAPASLAQRTLRFQVVKHTARYDVVKGHHHRLKVRHSARKVVLQSGKRFRVVKRTRHVIYLRAAPRSGAPQPTITTPNGGDIAVGSNSAVAWKTSTAASTGYYRVRLENTATGASLNLQSGVRAKRGVTRYSIPWNVNQAEGPYAVWVDYCSSRGAVISSDASDAPVNVTDATPLPTPTPTATVAPTPTPTATVTPTPTPSATGPAVPAGYTLVQNQTINNLATNGLHHRYYYKCTFTGGSATTAVLSFTGSSYELIFDACIVTTGGGWNGVTINDAFGAIHDITFKSTLFKSQGRMGFECTSRPTSATTQYDNINILNSTFEPQGNEAVSYDGGSAATDCTFSGNLIQGAGNDPAQEFGCGFEVNGPSNFTVENNTIWATRGSALNLQRHVTAPSGWIFRNNVIDASHRYQATAQNSSSQQVLAFNVYGGVFSGNEIISAAPGGSVAYLSGSHDMDWRTSTWRDASNRSGYQVPRLVDGSAGNQF